MWENHMYGLTRGIGGKMIPEYTPAKTGRTNIYLDNPIPVSTLLKPHSTRGTL